MLVTAPSSPCEAEIPFGAFALARYNLAFSITIALASSCLAFSAKRNGGGLVVKEAGTDVWAFLKQQAATING